MSMERWEYHPKDSSFPTPFRIKPKLVEFSIGPWKGEVGLLLQILQLQLDNLDLLLQFADNLANLLGVQIIQS